MAFKIKIFFVTLICLSFCILPLATANDALDSLNEGVERYEKDELDSPIRKVVRDALSSSGCSGSSTGNGTIHIKTVRDTWLTQFTVEEFKVKIRGDYSTNCYHEREDNSGNGFFQSGFTTFYNLPSGKFVVSIQGKDKNEGIFSVEATIEHKGEGVLWCTADITNKRISCNYR